MSLEARTSFASRVSQLVSKDRVQDSYTRLKEWFTDDPTSSSIMPTSSSSFNNFKKNELPIKKEKQNKDKDKQDKIDIEDKDKGVKVERDEFETFLDEFAFGGSNWFTNSEPFPWKFPSNTSTHYPGTVSFNEKRRRTMVGGGLNNIQSPLLPSLICPSTSSPTPLSPSSTSSSTSTSSGFISVFTKSLDRYVSDLKDKYSKLKAHNDIDDSKDDDSSTCVDDSATAVSRKTKLFQDIPNKLKHLFTRIKKNSPFKQSKSKDNRDKVNRDKVNKEGYRVDNIWSMLLSSHVYGGHGMFPIEDPGFLDSHSDEETHVKTSHHCHGDVRDDDSQAIQGESKYSKYLSEYFNLTTLSDVLYNSFSLF